VTKTYINGSLAGVVDNACQFADHAEIVLPFIVHPADTRYPTDGASKTYIEGFKAARVGDPLADGDAIAAGSSNTFVK
jgi:hypothetical protein